MQAGKHEKCVFFPGKIAFSIKTGHIMYAGAVRTASGIVNGNGPDGQELSGFAATQESESWKSRREARLD